MTVLDAVCLAAGLWLIGVSSPVVLGIVTAVMAWIPVCRLDRRLPARRPVAATDFPGNPAVAYAAIALFIAVRLLDDFIFMPLTIGKVSRCTR